MNTEDIKFLAQKFLNGTATEEEQKQLHDWYTQNLDVDAEEIVLTSVDENYDQVKNRLYMSILGQLGKANQKNHSVRKLWPRIAAVAAAVALIVLGVYFFNAPSRHLDDRRDLLTSTNDIAPGKNGATITLKNGTAIQLSDAKTGVVIGDDKLAYNDGEILRDALDDKGAKDMTASTTKGQTYIFTLPDGTKVWLNAASSLTIPSGFSGTESRKVALTGEAYFEVAKNKKRPFIVESNGQEVTVLGTHFNISAYKDEGSIKTTLLEGSVRVATSPPYQGGVPAGGGGRIGKTTPATPPLLGKEGTIILKPNQQAIITGSDRIVVANVDASDAIDWKNGEFKFKEETVESIMRKVERWYDVDVIYEKDAPRDIKLGGIVSRSRNVSAVLKMMELTNRIKFKIEGRKIVVEQEK